MYALIIFGLLALTLCLVLTPLCRNLAVKFDLAVDRPDGGRKVHSHAIPRVGGVAISLSYAGALALLLVLAPSKASIFIQHKNLLQSLLPAVVLVFITGLLDDLFELKPWQKLGGQFAAALIAVEGGARITLLDGHPYTAWITFPLSVFWLLVCTNAFNLIDGLDGLASGVGLFATLTVLLSALIQGNVGLAMATVPLVGCLLGFLRYNFNPASIFLGDSGSLTIGFLLGCFGVIWSQKSATFLGMLAPAMAFALPLFDVLLSIGRRFLRNKPIFQADAGHIHHRLLKLGFTQRSAALVLYAACGVAAALSLLQSSLGHHLGGLAVVLFCVFAFYGIKRLGYLEFTMAKRALTSDRFLNLVRQEVYLAHLREELAAAKNNTQIWNAVREGCHQLSFTSICLILDDDIFQHSFENHSNASLQLTISFGDRGRAILYRPMNESTQLLVSHFCHVLHHEIMLKLGAKEEGEAVTTETMDADVESSGGLSAAARAAH